MGIFTFASHENFNGISRFSKIPVNGVSLKKGHFVHKQLVTETMSFRLNRRRSSSINSSHLVSSLKRRSSITSYDLEHIQAILQVCRLTAEIGRIR